MKIFFRRIHLYLGLTAGAVIMIACLTGALLVFQKELEQSFHKDRYFVHSSGQRLSADSLIRSARQYYPSGKITGIKIYTDPERSAEVLVTETPKKTEPGRNTHSPSGSPNTKGAKQEEKRTPVLTVFVDPYTGKVLEVYNPRRSFFFKVMSLHRWLLGSNDGPGKYIVGISTLLFLIILITGIILWWPKTRKILVQRLKIKQNAGWKRLNHDLHIVLGFYSSIFLFVFAFTALPMSFEWFNNVIYKVTGSSPKPPAPPRSVYKEWQPGASLEAVLATAQTVLKDHEFYSITIPKDSVGVFTVSALSRHAAHEVATDAVYIDQYSGKIAGHQLYGERSTGAQVRSTFRSLHVSSIGGSASKFIGLMICLLGTSFPITGVILWLNRTRKKKQFAHRQKNNSFSETTP